MSRCLLFTCLLTISLVFTPPSIAFAKKPSKKIAREAKRTSAEITGMRSGDTWNNNSLFYDQTNDQMRVTGKFKKIPARIRDNDLKVVVSGFDIVQLPGSNMSISRKQGAKFTKASFITKLPAPAMLPWPLTDIVLELVYKPTNQVLARDSVSLFDLRFRPGSTASANPAVVGVALDYQLSNYGLGDQSETSLRGLEEVVFAELPYPSLEVFNQRLNVAASDLAGRSLEGLDACTPIVDLEEDRFRNVLAFSAYAEAMTEAQSLYQAYQQMQAGSASCGILFGFGSAICQAGLQGFCVKSPPQANDFELCIDKIQGRPVDLNVDPATHLQLEFLDSGSPDRAVIEAGVDFANYTGFVNGQLQNFTVRWKNHNCAGRPKGQLDNEEILQHEWLNEWAACPLMEVGAETATTRVAPGENPQYYVTKDPQDSQRLYVSDSKLSRFNLLNTSYDADKGSCALSFISPKAAYFLELFLPSFAGVLTDVWNEGAPNSTMAQRLDILFRPAKIADTSLPYKLTARINSVQSSASAGMFLDWATFVEPLDGENLVNTRPTYFAQESGPQVLATNALDPQNSTFDSKFGMTTSFMNRVLWARSASSELSRSISWTSEELEPFRQRFGSIPGPGIGLPPAVESSSTLTADFMRGLHPVFKSLKGKPVEFVIERQLDPLLYMPEDPSLFIPGVGFPITYGINAFKVKLKYLDDIKDGQVAKVGKTLITLGVNFTDSSFMLNFNPDFGAEVLNPLLEGGSWYFSILDSDLTDCPMFSHEFGVNQNTSCEREIEGALKSFLKSKLEDIFYSLVQDFPAPQFFDLEGVATTQIQSSSQSLSQIFGRVDLFGSYISQ